MKNLSINVKGIILTSVASLPSLIWILRGPGFLTDDFSFISLFREGMLEGAVQVANDTGRPFVGFWYMATYGVIDNRPILHACVMLLLNVSLILASWHVLKLYVNHNIAFAASLFFALIPNRSSTHFWFATSHYSLSMTLALVGFILVTCKGKPALGIGITIFSILIFEGAIGLIAALFLLWAAKNFHERWPMLVTVGSVTAAAGVTMLMFSPKTSGTDTLFENVGTIFGGLLHVGVWGRDNVGAVGATAFIVITGVSIIQLLPSYKTLTPAYAAVRAGLVLAFLSALPLATIGLAFAIVGFFDRNNIVPSLGISLVIAGAVGLISKPVINSILLIAIVAWFLVLQYEGVTLYRKAVREGDMILGRVLEDVHAKSSNILVVPSLASNTGTAAFVYPQDIDNAMETQGYDENFYSMPWNQKDCVEALQSFERPIIYNWKTRQILPPVEASCNY